MATSPPPKSLDRLQGLTLGDKYRLVAVLGSGASGYVYQAEQLGLGRSVAVKLLRGDRLGVDRGRFANEARAASRINHPNAVAIYDFGVSTEGLPYLVMEHLHGRTLTSLLEEYELPPERVVKIAAQILSALEEAHACGVVHRDLKSDNVVVETLRNGDDFVKVIDFGLAQITDDPTNTAEVCGTPEYMAPEQIRAEPLGPATDLYAVGVMLYEMIVGRTPFAGGSIPQVLRAHLEREAPAPHEVIPQCPQALSEIVLRALKKVPGERPPNARALRTLLLDCLQNADADEVPPRQRPQALPNASSRARARVRARTSPSRMSRLSCEVNAPRCPLIGRTVELARVERFYRGGDAASMLAVIGPAGMGKARLVLEAAGELAEDVTTFFSAADPTGLQTAWYPILSMLEAVLGVRARPHYSDLVEALARCGLPERDAPGLAELFGARGPLETVELAARRREAHAAAIRALRSVHRRVPGAVLCFADLDRYDQPSRQLIAALSEALDGSGTRVVVTCREHKHVPDGAAVLELRPLGRDDVMSLARTSSGMRLSQAAVERAGGLPASVEHVVGWIRDGNDPDSAPPLLVDLLTARVNRLRAGPRRLLQAIAVHGTVVSFAVLDRSVGGMDRAASEALTELVEAGLVIFDGCDLTISLRLLADVVLACTPADVRRELHRAALVAIDELDIKVSVGVVGMAAQQAGDLERAFSCMVIAGDDAVRRFDDPGGAVWYGRAISVARDLYASGESNGAEWVAEASVKLSDVLRFTGELGLAAGILDEADQLRAGSHEQAGIERSRGRLDSAKGKFQQAGDHYRRAIGLALRTGDRDLVCETYVDLAGALAKLGDPSGACSELSEGINVVTLGEGLDCAGGGARLWLLGYRLAELELCAGRCRAADQVAEAALAAAEQSQAAQARGRLYALRARIADAAGDCRAGLIHRARAIDELRRLGDRHSTAELLRQNARASSELMPVPGSGGHRWHAMTDDAMRIARELSDEIGVAHRTLGKSGRW